jgi:hypothetical protein
MPIAERIINRTTIIFFIGSPPLTSMSENWFAQVLLICSQHWKVFEINESINAEDVSLFQLYTPLAK